jgi:hypothetical protein
MDELYIGWEWNPFTDRSWMVCNQEGKPLRDFSEYFIYNRIAPAYYFASKEAAERLAAKLYHSKKPQTLGFRPLEELPGWESRRLTEAEQRATRCSSACGCGGRNQAVMSYRIRWEIDGIKCEVSFAHCEQCDFKHEPSGVLGKVDCLIVCNGQWGCGYGM